MFTHGDPAVLASFADAMTDAQLWAPAALMQFVRILLPFGHIWTPVIPYLISGITMVESESLDQISFYKDTVQFVEYLKSRSDLRGVAITGRKCFQRTWSERIFVSVSVIERPTSNIVCTQTLLVAGYPSSLGPSRRLLLWPLVDPMQCW